MISKQYLAGFVDGEAYLGIRKHTNKQSRTGYYYNIVVKIAQKRSANKILYEFQRLFNGDISHRKHSGNCNESTMWEISGIKRVSKFISELSKHLIVKKPQADILRKYIKLGNASPNLKKSKYIMGKRAELYKEILLLNHRGLAETE